MRIALVHEFLNQFGGGERVFLALKEVFPSADLFAILLDPTQLPEEIQGLKIQTTFLQRWPVWLRRRHRLLLPLYPLVVEQLDLSSYDLVIVDSSSFGKGVLTRADATLVCYCHTPTAFLWHYTQQYLEEQGLSNISKTFVRKILDYLRIWDYQAAQRVDFFVANSKNVQQRIKKYYHRDSEVIYPPLFFHAEDNKRAVGQKRLGSYFLVVSRLSRYKKIDLVISAFRKRPKDQLQIIGQGPDYERLKRMAGPNVKFVGFVSDEMLQKYYQNCRALIFPGEEDFGLVPIEAMAFGKPVIAYQKGGLLESVIENKNGVFFRRTTVSDLLDALERFEKLESRFNPEEIKESIRQFSKEVFQRKMREFIQRVTQKKI